MNVADAFVQFYGTFAQLANLVDVCIGVEVGRSDHHAVVLGRDGRKLLDRALPRDEAKLRTIYGLTMHGTVLLIVDQPATIGAPPVAMAQAEGLLLGYLPGPAIRRIATRGQNRRPG